MVLDEALSQQVLYLKGANMEEISQKDISFRDWISLAWALFWRGIIITIGSTISGALIGGILGFILGIICRILKYPFENIKIPFQIFCFLLGLGVGFCFLILLVKWFFRAKFGNFKIALIQKDA